MTTIKLIAVDLDGTLLNSKHELTERTEKALKAAMEKGVQVILATGKTRASATRWIDRLGLQSPGIYLQGLAVYDGDGTLRHQQVLDPDVARQVITYAEDRGFDVAAYSGQQIIMRGASKHADAITEFQEPGLDFAGPLQNLLGEMPINKLIALGDPKRIKALRWQLGMQLNGSARLMQTQLGNMLEILPPGASKGVALRGLLKEMEVPAEHVLAIGDAENDIEMIQLAGIGVAVGNASQALKDVADHVVASNDADGVAEAVERFVPGIEKSASSTEKSTTDPQISEDKTTA